MTDEYFDPPKPSANYGFSPFRIQRHFNWIIVIFVLAYGIVAGKLVLYGSGAFKSKEKTKVQLLKPTKARRL